jgi:hypothetical protein
MLDSTEERWESLYYMYQANANKKPIIKEAYNQQAQPNI